MVAFLLGGDNGGRNVKTFVICTSNVYYVILKSFVHFSFSQWVTTTEKVSRGIHTEGKGKVPGSN